NSCIPCDRDPVRCLGVLISALAKLLQPVLNMMTKALTMPEIGLIAGTRVALGVGIGLLLSNKFGRSQRSGAGWALLGVGIITTVPLILSVRSKPRVGPQRLELAS